MTAAEVLKALKQLREDAGSDVAVANVLRVKSNHVPRMLEKAPSDFHPLTATCIRIAAAIDRPARDVLDALGQGDVADAIEDYYREHAGAPRDRPVTLPSEVQVHLADWQHLPDHYRSPLGALVHALATDPRPHRRKPPATHAPQPTREDVSDLLTVEPPVEHAGTERSADRPRTRQRGAKKRTV